MNWAGWNDFFAMGGYAQYVWGSYLVTFGALAAEVAMLRLRRRNALEQVLLSHARHAGHTDETAA